MRAIQALLLTSILTIATVTALAEAEPASTAQTTCPVLKGSPIDKSIYTDYQGKRIYFCCRDCLAKFTANPEAYLSDLPQFAALAEESDLHGDAHGMGDADDHHEHGDEHGESSGWASRLGRLIEPLGVATYSSLVITILLGLFRRKLKTRFLPVHKVFAFLTLVLASAHATLIMILHG